MTQSKEKESSILRQSNRESLKNPSATTFITATIFITATTFIIFVRRGNHPDLKKNIFQHGRTLNTNTGIYIEQQKDKRTKQKKAIIQRNSTYLQKMVPNSLNCQQDGVCCDSLDVLLP